jgi:hypothetical protein
MPSVSKLILAGLSAATLLTGCAAQATQHGAPAASVAPSVRSESSGPSGGTDAPATTAAPRATVTPVQDRDYHPTTSNLLDLEKMKFYQGGAFDVPYRKGGCPAARLSWPLPKRDDVVNGVDYLMYGDSIYSLGDFNADGHSEVVIIVMCSAPGRRFGETAVVIGATGPSSYQTIAAGVVGPKVRGIVVQGATIIGYDADWQMVQADEVGRYRITHGDQITRISS